jgi:hypothetical protein
MGFSAAIELQQNQKFQIFKKLNRFHNEFKDFTCVAGFGNCGLQQSKNGKRRSK